MVLSWCYHDVMMALLWFSYDFIMVLQEDYKSVAKSGTKVLQGCCKGVTTTVALKISFSKTPRSADVLPGVAPSRVIWVITLVMVISAIRKP
jgi:hypothetical protein